MASLSIPWVPEDEWRSRTALDRPEAEAIRDAVWRVANLYDIRTDDGRSIPFMPTPEQRVIIWDILVRGYTNLVIPKARKLGMSTVLCVIAADKLAFEAGQEIALVDKTKDDAVEKLDRIVKFAMDSLHPRLRRSIATPSDNKEEIVVRSNNPGNDIVSSFRAGVSFRGGTPQMLLVSEWATIQFEQPARSEEIKTGAMEAARRGIRVIETTWKGGKGGHVWDYVKLAMETKEEDMTPVDWRLRFFPWWVDRRNVRAGKVSRIDEETNRYLDEKQAELGVIFSPEQRLWYYMAKQENGIFIKRENPTTLDECWSAPVEGAIYADLIERMRVERKILPLDWDEGLEVDTFWDLGSPANTVVWYVQRRGGEAYDLIDCDGGLDLTTDERVEHMRRKGYAYGAHYVPHDAAADQRGGLSYQEELMRAGLENVRVVPRTSDVEIGINAVRRMLPQCRINTRLCATGIEALSAYHAKREEGGTHRGERIVHDWSSHYCDAVRVIAEANSHGMLSGQGGRRFDVQGVKELDVKAKLADVKFGNITVMERGAQFIEGTENESWLALAHRPQVGRFHVIGYAATRVHHVWAVVRADYGDSNELGEPSNVCVVAGSVGPSMMDQDIAAQRVAATSLYFGSCLVVPVSDDPEGVHQALVAAGQDRIFKRRRAIVTKGQIEIGWKAGEDMSAPMGALARRVREEQFECFHAAARQQLGMFVRQPGGKTGAMAGYGDEWVKALAVACQCLACATPFDPSENRRARQEGIGASMWGVPMKASSL